jgi:hypothetical protein
LSSSSKRNIFGKYENILKYKVFIRPFVATPQIPPKKEVQEQQENKKQVQ